MKRVYGYCRVSTEQQDTQRQRDLVTNYCELNNYDLQDIIQEKISGAKPDRKSINRLLDLDNTLCDMIVVSELSRISRERDILKVLNTINEILQNGIDVLFLDEPNKTYSAGKQLELFDIITLAVKAQGAAEEREKIQTRMKTGKITKVNNYPYAYIGGVVPYGFKLIDNNAATAKNEPKQIIAIDESTINNVKTIFTLIISGKTQRDTAKYVNELGLRTNSKIEFNMVAIGTIIKNSIYYGKRRLKGKTYPIDCDIISEEEFNLANQRLTANQLFKNKGNKHFNPLKGILKCACGKSMLMQIYKIPEYSYYRCMGKTGAFQSEYHCKNGGVSVNLLLDTVWKVVKATLKLEEYVNTNNKQIKEKNNIVESLFERIEMINSEIEDNLLKAFDLKEYYLE